MLGKHHLLGGIGSEEPAIERAVEAPGRRRAGGQQLADLDQAHVGELRRRELGERLDHPARLQRPVGEHADTQPARLRTRGQRYSRQTPTPPPRTPPPPTTPSLSLLPPTPP